MKKWMPVLAALLLNFSLSAQYKKVSFFAKTGRTYEAGTQLYAFGHGLGSPVGFKIGFGGDQDGKQFFSSWELAFIPSYKYSYSTTDESTGDPATISGTTKSTLVYSIHYCFHLLKNDDEERVVKPFVTAGLFITLTGGVKTVNPQDSYNMAKQPDDHPFNQGLSGGAGTLINFSPKLGLKLQGGYSYVFHFTNDYGGSEKPYYLYPKHPYVSLSLRIRIVSQN